MNTFNKRLEALRLLKEASDFCFKIDYNGNCMNVSLGRKIEQFLKEIQEELYAID